MTVDNQDLKGLLERIKLLLPEYRLRLMQGILDTLVPAQPTETTTMIQLGQFKEFNGPISRYEDYALAEWWPTERGWVVAGGLVRLTETLCFCGPALG